MENDIGFRFHLWSPDPNLLHFPFDLKAGSVLGNPQSAEDSMPRTIPFPGLPQLSAHATSDIIRHKFSPLPKEKLAGVPFSFGQERAAPPRKRFLVFDQCGDKTKLIYSTDVRAPLESHACRLPSLPTAYNLHREELVHPLQPCIVDESVEDNSRDISGDELREDTEELDALLCSDYDSDFLEDEEEMSTGHSPSSMTGNGNGILEEEVDSLAGPMKKRQKILDEPSKRRTMSFVRTTSESSSKEEVELSSGLNKAKIQETLSILQSIIPSTEGKDAMIVIDEAIDYLRSLKAEAEALGLDSI